MAKKEGRIVTDALDYQPCCFEFGIGVPNRIGTVTSFRRKAAQKQVSVPLSFKGFLDDSGHVTIESQASESPRKQSPRATEARRREFTGKERGLEAPRMPVYVYQCQVCGNEQELLHGIREKPKSRLHCEVCGKRTPVVRLITTVAGGPTTQANPPGL